MRASEASTSDENSKRSSSIWHEFAIIVHENGFSDLYRGLNLRVVYCVFSTLVIIIKNVFLVQNRNKERKEEHLLKTVL